MKCCICGKEFKGFGNNPNGALDLYDRPIDFKFKDRCCDQCNQDTVVPGRIKTWLKRNSLLK